MSKFTLTFDQPTAELPEPAQRQYEPAQHWMTIGARCLQHEGLWVPVRIEGISEARLKAVPSEIRHGKLAAFRNWPGFEARYQDGTLYVRYTAPAVEDTTNLRSIAGGAA
jgi:hypothetical protein